MRHTPIQDVNGITVKREDEYAEFPYPKLAKLRGIELHVKKKKAEGFKYVGVLDTRVSKAGQGVSAVCKKLDMKAVVGFPIYFHQRLLHEQQKVSLFYNDAILFPLTAGRVSIMYSKVKNHVEDIGGYMMPMGLKLKETVDEVAKELEYTLKEQVEKLPKTIVVCTGTGTIFTGLIKGLKKFDGIKLLGVSCGMSTVKQRKVVESLLGEELPHYAKLVDTKYDYYDVPNFKAPFPCHKNYDLKTWEWLMIKKRKLEHPVLFWNIGA